MVYNCVFWLNSFPHKDGVHATMSPRAIITGQIITYNKHCKLEFGTYVQTHEKHNNSMEPRISGAIALRPSRNEQGGLLPKPTNRKTYPEEQLDCIACAKDVVDAIYRLVAASKQSGGITFMDRNSNIIIDEDKDETEKAEENEPIPVADDNYDEIIHNNNEEIMNEQQESNTITGVDENDPNDLTNDYYIQEHDPEDTHNITQIIPEEEKNESDEYVTIGDINITSETNTSNRESEIAEDEETGIGLTKDTIYNQDQKIEYNFSLALSDEQSIVLPKTHAHMMMTQLNIKDGLKAFGNKGD